MTIWARTQDPWGDNLQEAGEGWAGDGGQVLRLRQRTGGAKLKLFLKLSLDKKISRFVLMQPESVLKNPLWSVNISWATISLISDQSFNCEPLS